MNSNNIFSARCGLANVLFRVQGLRFRVQGSGTDSIQKEDDVTDQEDEAKLGDK